MPTLWLALTGKSAAARRKETSNTEVAPNAGEKPARIGDPRRSKFHLQEKHP
jgi:hypothetical protein